MNESGEASVYGLIWRVLPGGRVGKTLGSLVLLAAVAAFLWYVAFPWAEPRIPVDQAGVEPVGTSPAG